jgi:hypothetical protein
MNDLEICKKIAEIEGHVFDTGGRYFRCELIKHDMVVGYIDYNPLTDDALCFQLQNHYEVCVHYGSGDVFICGGDNFDGCLSVKSFDIDDKKTLNKAICLAIIEANK